MADCSKTEVFLSEWNRMCDYYKDVPCEKCPACEYCCYSEGVVDEDILHTVQKWSNEHPLPKKKTYADDFFEKHPRAKKSCAETPPVACALVRANLPELCEGDEQK